MGYISVTSFLICVFQFCSGDLKCGGFSLDACHSMVALMDVSSLLMLIFFMALRSFIYTLLSCLTCDYRTVAHNIKAAIALDLTGQTVQGISTLTS